MKILFIWHAAADPGNQRLFHEAVRRRGVELLVIAPRKARERQRLWTIRRPFTIRGAGSGSRFTLSPGRVVRLRRGPGYDLYLDLPSRLAGFKPDIIHVAEEAGSLAAAGAALLRPVFAPHASLVLHLFRNVSTRYRWPWPAIERAVLRRADAIVTSGPEVVRVTRLKGYRGPAFLRTWGADEREFRPGTRSPVRSALPPGGPVIGWAGRMFLGKGLQILLRASALMRRPHRLLVVGSGPLEADMRKLAARLDISRRISWAGAVPPDKMARYYSAMDVFCHPTISRPPDMPDWKEQFAKTQIEAMLSGLPVVSTTSGDNAWGVGDGGLIVREKDAAALARALDSLAGNARLRRALGRKARARALANFTWRKAADGLIDIWRGLKKEHR